MWGSETPYMLLSLYGSTHTAEKVHWAMLRLVKLVKQYYCTTLPSSGDSANILAVKDVTSPRVNSCHKHSCAPSLSVSFHFWTGWSSYLENQENERLRASEAGNVTLWLVALGLRFRASDLGRTYFRNVSQTFCAVQTLRREWIYRYTMGVCGFQSCWFNDSQRVGQKRRINNHP